MNKETLLMYINNGGPAIMWTLVVLFAFAIDHVYIKKHIK